MGLFLPRVRRRVHDEGQGPVGRDFCAVVRTDEKPRRICGGVLHFIEGGVMMKGNASARRILVTDIGGTHSRVALFEGSPPAMRAEATVSSDAADFDAVLAGAGRAEPALFAEKAHCLVVAAAAPVTGQEVLRLTNQPWSIRRAQLAPFADAVVFINDFEAQARACAMPLMEGAMPLLPGNGGGAFSRTRLARGLCVVGAGTTGGACASARRRRGTARPPSPPQRRESTPTGSPASSAATIWYGRTCFPAGAWRACTVSLPGIRSQPRG